MMGVYHEEIISLNNELEVGDPSALFNWINDNFPASEFGMAVGFGTEKVSCTVVN